jgi:hypothetical protein
MANFQMADIIKHPFCQRRHPGFPADSLCLIPPPDMASMKAELAKHGGVDSNAFKKLAVILPQSTDDELMEALHSDE